MAYAYGFGGVAVLITIFFVEIRFNIFKRCIYGASVKLSSSFPEIYKIYCVFKIRHYIYVFLAVFAQKSANIKGDFYIIIQLFCVVIVPNEVRLKIQIFFYHTRICVEMNLIFALFLQQNLCMVHVKTLNKLTVQINDKLRICGVPAAFASCGNRKIHIFAFCFDFSVKSAVRISSSAPVFVFAEQMPACVHGGKGVILLVTTFLHHKPGQKCFAYYRSLFELKQSLFYLFVNKFVHKMNLPYTMKSIY